MDNPLPPLVAAVERVCTADQRQWLAASLVRLRASEAPLDDLTLLSARARRALGASPLATGDDPLPVAGLDMRRWHAADAGRAAMALAVLESDQCDAGTVLHHLYRMGDDSEKVAVIRALTLFGADSRLKSVALDAGRTNNTVLFSALASYNPFPAAHYTEHEFNQLVLKALFMGIALDSVTGLGERANPRLSRMCEDYHQERTAAGRQVPPDIWLALAPHASDTGRTLTLRSLSDPDPAHRYWAAIGLGRCTGLLPEVRQLATARLALEPDQAVRSALAKITTSQSAGRKGP